MNKIYLLLLTIFALSLISPLKAQNTQIQYLSGIDKDHTIDWGFYIDRGMNSGKWTTIPVPSNWELQGFGVYNYGRGKQPESNETAQYRHKFTVPKAWKGKVVNIIFEGVMTDTQVKINGKLAGAIHQGSFYRFKYDISSLLNYDTENTLEVQVKNWSENASVNSAERAADYWLFGGIFRPVYLEALPVQHIDWTAIDAKADGSFLMHVYLNNNRNITEVSAKIQDMAGNSLGEEFSIIPEKKAPKITLNKKFADPKHWTPETPNRYQVTVKIKNKNGLVHTIREKFGFRTVELRPRDGFYVNGVKIKFKGVNRHTHWPESGRCSSKELSIRDVMLIKEMNMNAARMSHYPPDKHFLDVCDSLGLFVLDELAGWQTMYDSLVGRKLVKEMLIKDVNHPCIVIWDNGNEGGNNTALDDDFHIYDPQKRPVIHPWENFRGMDTGHYRHFGCCVDQLYHGKEVFVPTEFLHGLYDGGHGAGLKDHWQQMMEHPLSAGMFLWVFADEGTVRTDKGGEIDTDRSNAPDGIVGPYREKEGSFFTIKELWSPVQPKLKLITTNFDGNILLENNYHYTNLKECRFEWSLVKFPKPAHKSINQYTPKTQANSPDIRPGERGTLRLNLPKNWQENDALRLKAINKFGKEIYTWVWPIKKQKEYFSDKIKAGKLKASGADEGDFIILKNENLEIKIDKSNGQIIDLKSAGTHISLGNGPLADTTLGETKILGLNHYQEGLDYVLAFEFDPQSITKKLEYRLLSNGLLKLHYEYLPKKGFYDHVGLDFRYPEEKVKGVRWLGEGPYRVWKNRLDGVELGIWQKDYNNTVTGESGWVYPEFKGFHSQLYWAIIDNQEKPFAILCETENIYLRLFSPEAPKGAYNKNTDGIFPSGDISLMHAISPIGTKFKKAEYTSPSGAQNRIFYHRNPTNLEMILYFDFNL